MGGPNRLRALGVFNARDRSATLLLSAPTLPLHFSLSMPSFDRRFLFAVVFGLALAATFATFRAGLATDDMYITYRYASNLADGRGLVFNPGERVFGVTDPGVAVLLAALRTVTRAPIPWLGSALHAAALFVISLLVALAARARGRAPEGMLAGALVITSPFLRAAQGSGPPVALALLLAAAWWVRERPLLAGVLGGFAVLCRADALAGVGILGLLTLVERLRAADRRVDRSAVRAVLPFGVGALGPIFLGAAAAWAWFGTVLPNTLAAKRAYAASDPEAIGGVVVFARSTFQLLSRPLVLAAPQGFAELARSLILALLALGLLGWIVIARSQRARAASGNPDKTPESAGGHVFALLALFALVIAVVYPLLGVPYFLWYVIPPVVALLVGAPFSVGAVVRSRNVGARGTRLVATIVFTIPLAAAIAGAFANLDNSGEADWRRTAYTAAGRWLRENAAPEAEVAAEEIGFLGYESDRPISDLVGLVTPRSIPFAQDRLGAFLVHPTEYLIFHTYNARGGTRPIVARPWFRSAYTEVARFPARSTRQGELEAPYLAIYQRVPGGKIPPPRPPRGPGEIATSRR